MLLIWELLKEKPHRAPELAEKLGYGVATVHHRLRRLNLCGLARPLSPIKIGRVWSYPWAVDEKALERALASPTNSSVPTSEASPASPEATTSAEGTQAAR